WSVAMNVSPGLESLICELVAIESVNPDIAASGGGETAIAGFVASWLRAEGLVVHLVEPEPGRPSVVGVLRGSGGGRSLMLNAHLDTVGVAGMTDPFTARVDGRRLYGRGAYDMKGSLAAIMLAARRLSARRGRRVASAAGDGLSPRLPDRGRPRAVDLPRPLRAEGRAADAPRGHSRLRVLGARVDRGGVGRRPGSPRPRALRGPGDASDRGGGPGGGDHAARGAAPRDRRPLLDGR